MTPAPRTNTGSAWRNSHERLSAATARHDEGRLATPSATSSADDAARRHGRPCPLAARGGRRLGAAVLGLALLIQGCELVETATAVLEDVIIAEVYVHVGQPKAGRTMAYAFLHRTVVGSLSRPVPGAAVVLTLEDGERFTLEEREAAACYSPSARTGEGNEEVVGEPEFGTCYYLETGAGTFLPGAAVTLDIALPDGGGLAGLTTIPEDFRILIPSSPACLLEPRTVLETVWTKSGGARAYVNESLVYGVGDAIDFDGFRADDAVELIGVTASEADTAVLFPDEYGAFSRFDLPVQISRGADRRPGLRTPRRSSPSPPWISTTSIGPGEEDSTRPGSYAVPASGATAPGVFGSSVTHSFRIVAGEASGGIPSCSGLGSARLSRALHPPRPQPPPAPRSSGSPRCAGGSRAKFRPRFREPGPGRSRRGCPKSRRPRGPHGPLRRRGRCERGRDRWQVG